MREKAELLETVAGKNRGLLANEIDKVAVLSAVVKLEDINPNPKPLERLDLLEGDWRLLYTTSNSLLNLDRFPGLQLGQIYQCVRTTPTRIYNIAEVVGIPFLEGLVSVTADFEAVSQKRVNVNFERSIFNLQRFIQYRSPQEFIRRIEAGEKFFPFDFSIKNREREAWLDTTYLDEDLRIGRGNEGSVFVLSKKS